MLIFETVQKWLNDYFFASLGSAVSGALYSTNDCYIMHRKITHPNDDSIAVAFYLIVGAWIGVLMTLVLNNPFGQLIDGKYSELAWGNWKIQKFAFVTGFLGALSTLLYLWGNQKFDASLVLGLSNVSIFGLAIYDCLTGNLTAKEIILPVLLMFAGSFLASIKQITGGIKILSLGLIVLLLGRGTIDTLEAIARQAGGSQIDAICFNFWRFFWLAVCGTIMMIAMVVLKGKMKELLLMRKKFFPALLWIAITMFFVFFSNTLSQKAMQDTALSKVFVVLSFKMALGIPFTLIINWWKPGVLGEVPKDKKTWIARSVGVAVICINTVLVAIKRGSI